jgi:hypothetical protein
LIQDAEARRKGNADQRQAIQDELDLRLEKEREEQAKLEEFEEELERLAPEREKTLVSCQQ